MSTALRAAVSVAMPAGFSVLGLVQLAVAGLLLYEIWGHLRGYGAAKLSRLVIIGVGAVVLGIGKALFARPGDPEGVLVTPQQAPDLWRLAGAMATAAGTRAPDEIRPIPEGNAAVTEDARLLGLVAGGRSSRPTRSRCAWCRTPRRHAGTPTRPRASASPRCARCRPCTTPPTTAPPASSCRSSARPVWRCSARSSTSATAPCCPGPTSPASWTR
ncbi:hypothetical protein Ade02nite_59860 [Paractinoplanes deccanensis]|uniref:Uncharacterized protein n=1 Tax=Paractinoplanes deccanensis TaxID=113561 RepID=A0ABQ3YBG2_9ACTN|nr:hypothetical protein [Actinoplanes deccanensis]GID77345.1 hypothetical protein Ade02nite_59860 [Actinoplanes deccanensis]